MTPHVLDAPALPAADAPWADWVDYGLLWAQRTPEQLTAPLGRPQRERPPLS
ncbi:MAG: hypothetical protein V9F00_12310 [Nocardioides sp.]